MFPANPSTIMYCAHTSYDFRVLYFVELSESGKIRTFLKTNQIKVHGRR